jgi:hypothetical protein
MYNYESLHFNKLLNLFIVLIITAIEILTFFLIFFFIIISFGANITENLDKTIIFSFLSCLICITPSILFVKHENPFRLLQILLIENYFKNGIEKLFAYASFGFIFGSWLGALMIPLGK